MEKPFNFGVDPIQNGKFQWFWISLILLDMQYRRSCYW